MLAVILIFVTFSAVLVFVLAIVLISIAGLLVLVVFDVLVALVAATIMDMLVVLVGATITKLPRAMHSTAGSRILCLTTPIHCPKHL